MHTIHGLCHLCIGCRLPQVCSHSADQEDISRKTPSPFFGDFLFLVWRHQGRKKKVRLHLGDGTTASGCRGE